MSYIEFVRSRAKQLPARKDRIDHALLGMLTELGEIASTWKKHTIYEQQLNKENIFEELGDFAFYLQMLLNDDIFQININIEREDEKCIDDFMFRIALNVGEMYQRFDVHNITRIEGAFIQMVERFGMNLEDILSNNMKKLTERYPIR